MNYTTVLISVSLFPKRKTVFIFVGFEKVFWPFSSKKQNSGTLSMLSEKIETHI